MKLLRTQTGFFCGIALACLSASSVAANAQDLKLPPVVRTALGNGVKVVLMEYHRAPTLVVRALFPGGAKLDPEGRTGSVAMMAELLKQGTETRTAPEIAEAVDFLGGSLDVSAGDEECIASLDVLAKDADQGLDLMADVLRHPKFPQAELERVRALEISGRETIGDNPRSVAAYVLDETMYAGHPYGRETTVTSLKAITRDDVLGAYAAAIAPAHMTIIAVGDFKASEMLARLEKRFGDWHGEQREVPATPPVPAARVRNVVVDKPDATQTQLRIARVAFPRSSPDYFPAVVANAILGGGFTSRLIDEIRVNRSLTYGISSAFPTQKAGGLFEVSTFTKLETTKALIDAVRDVLAKAATGGLTQAEYTKTQGYLAGQFAVHVQTPEALAGQLAEIAIYDLPADYLDTYLSRLRAVKLADVNRIAKTYFAPEALSMVLVTPLAKTSSQLTGLSDIERRSVDSVAK